MKARLAAVAAGLSAYLVVAGAAAEPMDPAIERLVINPTCHGDPFGALTGSERCVEDNAAFKRLVAQYGFALAPIPTNTARTTGYGGFHVSIEAAYTSIDHNAHYWTQGTQGAVDPSTNQASSENTGPAPVLQVYSVKLRKSFGFGFEVAGTVGTLAESNILSGGADVRLSLLEGFRTGIPGYIPDVAVGGAVRTITGTPQLQLTVVGVDVQLSKPIPIADSSIITPYAGYQHLFIFGDSGLVDLTPATDAIGYCNYSGPNLPGNPEPGGDTPAYDGEPVCQGGSARDFNDNSVFDKARLERQRLFLGLNYRYEMVILGATFVTDIVDPGDAQVGDGHTKVYPNGDLDEEPLRLTDKQLLKDMPRQWTIGIQVGTMF